MIRVAGGRWKGRRLEVPRGTGTRPSASRLREALFSALSPLLRDAPFADLFAGSGALGIEALSRGAREAVFVELDPRALRTIAANLEALGADPSSYRIQRGDARRWLERQLRDGDRVSVEAIVVLDPPYDAGITGQLLPLGWRLVESGRCRAFALEHPAGAEVDESVLGARNGSEDAPATARPRLRTRRHGAGAFTLIDRG